MLEIKTKEDIDISIGNPEIFDFTIDEPFTVSANGFLTLNIAYGGGKPTEPIIIRWGLEETEIGEFGPEESSETLAVAIINSKLDSKSITIPVKKGGKYIL